MVQSISSVGVSNYYSAQIKKQNNNKINLAQSSANISFKSNPTAKVASVVSKKATSQTLKGLFLTLVGLIGLGSAKGVSNYNPYHAQVNENLLKKYRTKYPELMEYLDNVGYSYGRDDEHWESAFNDKTKVLIVKAYEKDPQEAYTLAKKLEYDESNSYSEELLEEINSNYDELKKYNKRNLEDAYKKMNIAKENPYLENIALIPGLESQNLAEYSSYCVDEKSKIALEKALTDTNNKIYATIKAASFIELAEICKKYPDIPGNIVRNAYYHTTNDKIKATIEKYSGNWDKLSEAVNKHGIVTVAEMDDYLEYPKHIEFTQKNKPSNTSAKEYIEKLIMLENILKEIENAGHQPYELNALNKLLYENIPFHWAESKNLSEVIKPLINTINKDDINLYRRMIKDNRCGDLSTMQKLLPLYRKYPDTEITNEMVVRFNDPAIRAMNLY